MEVERRPQTCKWAEPTLLQPWPMWLDAWSWPWCCRIDHDVPRLLPTTSECRECRRWRPRETPEPECRTAAGALHGRRCGSAA
jgi:hypothetical protein